MMNGGTVPGGMNARAVDVADGFGHCLGHVRARVEVQFHQRHALDILRLDVVDAGDVEKVVFVVVRQVSLHLRRVHAAVWLADVYDRQVQTGEDVNRHLANCEDAAQRDADKSNDHGKGTIQCEADQPHEDGSQNGRA